MVEIRHFLQKCRCREKLSEYLIFTRIRVQKFACCRSFYRNLPLGAANSRGKSLDLDSQDCSKNHAISNWKPLSESSKLAKIFPKHDLTPFRENEFVTDSEDGNPGFKFLDHCARPLRKVFSRRYTMRLGPLQS